MSKGIEFKAYHLSELAKENAGDSCEIKDILEKVEKFKKLDLNNNLDQIVLPLTKVMSEKLLEFSLFEIRNYVSQEENFTFIQESLDLKPLLVNFTAQVVGKIDQELSDKLDEIIAKV